MLTALFRCVKNKDKETQLTLVLDKKDKEICELIENIDEFLFFDREKVVERLSSSTYTLVQNHEYIEKQLKSATTEPIDTVINAGCDNLSAIVTSMMGARSVEGATFDEYGKKWIENPWFSYLNDTCEDKQYNLFHYIDVVTGGCGVFSPEKKSLPVEQPSISKRVIIELSEYEHGTELGRDLGQRIEKNYRGFNVVITEGKLKTTEMAELIKSSSVLVTSNYIYSMIASIFGKKVVFVASDDNYMVNGPYGEGHWILKKKKNALFINDDLFSFFGFAFCQEDRTALLAPNMDIISSGYDRDGFIEYVPFLKMGISEKEFYNWIYKSVWKCTIGRKVRAGDPQRFLAFGEKYIDRVVEIDREVEYLKEKVLTKYDQDNIKVITDKFNEALNSVIELKETAFEGQKKAREFLNTVAISSDNLEEIKKKKQEITEIDTSISEMLHSDKIYLEAIIRSFMRERDDSHVTNLFPLAKRIISNYEDLFS
ncbi:MAG: hypothetical protein WCQ53_07645, partial [bacterium]